MTKTEALILLADALKESKQLHQLRFLLAEFTLAVAQHKDGKLSTQQLIARLRNLAHIEALSHQEEDPAMSSQYTFSQVPKTSHPRSNFTRSHGYKTTLDAGYLIPFYVDEVLPATRST